MKSPQEINNRVNSQHPHIFADKLGNHAGEKGIELGSRGLDSVEDGYDDDYMVGSF